MYILVALGFTALGLIAAFLGFHYANQMNKNKHDEKMEELLRMMEKVKPQTLEILDVYNKHLDEQAEL